MRYEKDTYYWLLGSDKQWQPILYNVDGQFLISDRFFSLSEFELIFKDNKTVKAIMPTDIGLVT